MNLRHMVKGLECKMRVMVLGLRGFPNIQGGVEKHAENLYPRLVKAGCEVEALVRSPYMDRGTEAWHGVRFRRIWAPRSKNLEAFVHTFIGVLYAGVKRPDILHIHAVGPALLVPLARLLGLRVVVTHHGPDYEREKWNRFSRFVIRQGERWGMTIANQRIVISQTINRDVREKYRRESYVIPNGVAIPNQVNTQTVLQEIGVGSAAYILMVSRLVPEKRHLDLVDAFAKADLKGWKLILVGGSDHPDEYTAKVQKSANSTQNVIAAGVRSGQELAELYAHAGLFVLPSSHEGLPIVILEALSYGIPVIASNIPANREVGLEGSHYFPLGDIDQLARKLTEFTERGLESDEKEQLRKWVIERYDWNDIALRTKRVYAEAIGCAAT